LGTRDEDVALVAAARAHPYAKVRVDARASPRTNETRLAEDARADVNVNAEPLEHAPQNPTRPKSEHARGWEAYAFEHGASALPASPLVIAAHTAHLDAVGFAPSSLDVAMAAIVDRHRAARVALPSNDPAARDVLAGIR
jgi:hypothetical protein